MKFDLDNGRQLYIIVWESVYACEQSGDLNPCLNNTVTDELGCTK